MLLHPLSHKGGYCHSQQQYIPWNMHLVLLCFVLLWLYHGSWWIYMVYLPISFRVASLALGQSYDCPSASEATLIDMDKTNQYQTTAKHNKTWTLCIILGINYFHKIQSFAAFITYPPLGSLPQPLISWWCFRNFLKAWVKGIFCVYSLSLVPRWCGENFVQFSVCHVCVKFGS